MEFLSMSATGTNFSSRHSIQSASGKHTFILCGIIARLLLFHRISPPQLGEQFCFRSTCFFVPIILPTKCSVDTLRSSIIYHRFLTFTALMLSFIIIISPVLSVASSLNLAAGDCWLIITDTKIYSTQLFHYGVDTLAWVTCSALPLQTTNKGIQCQPRSISYNTKSAFEYHTMRLLSNLWPHRSIR